MKNKIKTDSSSWANACCEKIKKNKPCVQWPCQDVKTVNDCWSIGSWKNTYSLDVMTTFIESRTPHKSRGTIPGSNLEDWKCIITQYSHIWEAQKENKDSERLTLRGWHLTKERNSLSHQSGHFTEDAMKRRKVERKERQCKKKGNAHKNGKAKKWKENITTFLCVTLKWDRSPCNHLLLLIGGMATAAQDFRRCWQEVEAVVFEILVD